MSKALWGEHYCLRHQGNHSHYAEANCTVCVAEKRIFELEAELSAVDAALDVTTRCQAPTRAQRIADTLEHNGLIADAAVFDANKAEQSVRAQCIYWMGAARIAARERDEARREVQRLNAVLTTLAASTLEQKTQEYAIREMTRRAALESEW